MDSFEIFTVRNPHARDDDETLPRHGFFRNLHARDDDEEPTTPNPDRHYTSEFETETLSILKPSRLHAARDIHEGLRLRTRPTAARAMMTELPTADQELHTRDDD